MEAIRNYLESMFANLPNTPEVQRAKTELGQMMEDKYQELIEEGKTDNEAVGIVISDFGNLDELADSLGIRGAMQAQPQIQARMLSGEEVQDYVTEDGRNTFANSIGVMLCIFLPIPYIAAECIVQGFHAAENVPFALATIVFFTMMAAAIALFVVGGIRMEKWKFLKKEPVCIDYATADYLQKAGEADRSGHAVLKVIGILLCVFCFVPVAVIGSLTERDVPSMIGAIVLFLCVGIGVMLLINASAKEDAYKTLLRLNSPSTVGGNYVPSQKEVRYTNPSVQKFMSVYNPTILCIYLCWSFLTFDWHITWIIWPIAAIVRYLINSTWGEKGGKF